MVGGCVILGDSAVHDLLINLSRTDILTFQHQLGLALTGWSTSEREFQPDPSVIARPDGQKVLYRPFTSRTSVGTKIIVDPAPHAVTGAKAPLHGVLVLCDRHGIPSALINAEEVTAFRTSLAALIPWMWRAHTQRIVVFGAGKQALWHIRLGLALRGEEIEDVVVVNRTRDRAEELVQRGTRENAERWKSRARIHAVDWEAEGSGEVVRKCLAEADVIWCTVPAVEPLFAARDVIRSAESRKPLVSAIGSWQPNMIELDPALLRRVLDEDGAFHPIAGVSGGAIIVDDRKSVMEHTGEMLQSKIPAERLVEVGEVLKMKDGGADVRFLKWLREDFLIYKSVGVSLTDLAAGEAIMELAKQKGIGSQVDDL